MNYYNVLGNFIRTILEIIKEMRSFLIILALALIGFSLVFFQFNRSLRYYDHLLNMYNLIYGNFSTDSLSLSEVSLLVVITFLVYILSNLLIAIMGGTFGKV